MQGLVHRQQVGQEIAIFVDQLVTPLDLRHLVPRGLDLENCMTLEACKDHKQDTHRCGIMGVVAAEQTLY